MAPEPKLLLWTVALTFTEAVAAALAANGQFGLAALAGNRQGMPRLSGLAGRALVRNAGEGGTRRPAMEG